MREKEFISRAEKVKEFTASSDFNGSFVSSTIDTKSELQPEKHHVDLPALLKLEQNVKEVNGSVDPAHYASPNFRWHC